MGVWLRMDDKMFVGCIMRKVKDGCVIVNGG